jgi:hypothetical protein
MNRIATALGAVVMATGLFSTPAANNKWQSPKSGWLFVLDADITTSENHVLLVDPNRQSIEGKITVGPQPEIAVSQDGSRIAVISGPAERGEIELYDSRTGSMISTLNVRQRALLTTPPQSSTMAFSRDGRWLFVPTMESMAPSIDEYGVSRYEVSGTSIAPAGHALLPECGVAEIFAESGDQWDLGVYCPLSNTMRRILFGSDGLVVRYSDTNLTVSRGSADLHTHNVNQDETQAVLYNGLGQGVWILTASAQLCRVGLSDSGSPCNSFDGKLRGRWISDRVGVMTGDGHLYLGSGPVQERNQQNVDAVEIVDTISMSISSIKTPMSFWSLAFDARNRLLYGANPRAHKIIQIDPTKGETKEIPMLDYNPAVIVPVT